MIANATFNPILTTKAVKFIQNQQAFVGRRLFPVFNSALQSADYPVWNKENLLTIPKVTQRAPSSPFSRSKTSLNDDNYNCREYGHEVPVDDGQRAKYSNQLDLDTGAAERASWVVLYNHEKRVYDLATDAAVPNSSPGTKWDAGGSDPIANVDTAKESVYKNTGMEINTMVVNRDVFNILKEHSKVIDKIKYTQRAVVTTEILAAVFGVRDFIVAGAVINNAAEGQTLDPAYIWGDSVVLAHVEFGQTLEVPNFGRTFNWTQRSPNGMVVESYREDDISSDIHRARQYVDEKLVGADAGYHLSDVLT